MKRSSSKAWWPPLRARLRVAFENCGIVRCEAGYVGCAGGLYLGFAHSLRRAWIKTDAEKREVALLCSSCHQITDCGSHEEVAARVRAIIAAREVQPVL